MFMYGLFFLLLLLYEHEYVLGVRVCEYVCNEAYDKKAKRPEKR